MTGTIRIGGALVLGILIVLVSLRVSAKGDDTSSEDTLALSAPERTYIESQDSDGDGVKDWEEVLQERFIDTISATSSENLGFDTTEEYVPPTTLTGKFSEAFFQDYLEGKVRGVDYSDPSVFIADAIGAIEKNTQSVTHSRVELNAVPSSPELVHDFGNTLSLILQKNAAQEKSEALILSEALDANNPDILKNLDPIISMYSDTIKEALLLEIPSSLVEEHLAFLDACEANLANVQAMRLAFQDPLLALARMKQYEESKKSLFHSFQGFALAFTAEDIFFEKDEPGNFFYLFEKI